MKNDELRIERRIRGTAARMGMQVNKSRSPYGFTSLHSSGPRYMLSRDNTVVQWGNLDDIAFAIESAAQAHAP